jgi:protein-tyrosine phosphatase
VIDIHHHCLPGVDDGPRDFEGAVALCRMAADDGIETIIATPHVLRGRWQNTSRPALEEIAATLRQHVGETPRILLGSEYFFAHDVVEVVANGTAVIPLAGSRYILIEFASHTIPPMVDQPFYRLQLDGWTPVIAHPERNAVFQAKPDLLASLVRLGAKTQVTAGSLLGDFGPEAKEAAFGWIAAGMVHAVASDAHNIKKRPPRMTPAFAAVRDTAGETIASALFRDNPRAIVEGRGLPFDPEPQGIEPRSGLLGRLGKLFKGH